MLGIAGEEHSGDPDYDIMDTTSQAEAAEWQQKIRAQFPTRTVGEWVADFDAAGAPVSPVHLPEEMADDPSDFHPFPIRDIRTATAHGIRPYPHHGAAASARLAARARS